MLVYKDNRLEPTIYPLAFFWGELFGGLVSFRKDGCIRSLLYYKPILFERRCKEVRKVNRVFFLEVKW